jgi:GNAT superfamily N-acetyltransferase
MTAEPFTLRRLDRSDIPVFEELTYPAFRKRLWAGEPMVAIGARQGLTPVGLALAAAPSDGRVEVLSLCVQEAHRGHGLGTQLLTSLEEALRDHNDVHVASCTYVEGSPARVAIERVLAKCGWTPPIGRMLMFQGELETLSRAHWLQNVELSDDFFLVPWGEITARERESLQRWQQAENWIPQDLEPWRHEDDFDAATSLGLRQNGRLVGWVLTHRLSADMVRFSSGWVHPSLQRRGRLFALYAAAGEKAMAQGCTRASWTVPLHHEAKAAFARRWMAPLARCRETYGSVKLLQYTPPVESEN